MTTRPRVLFVDDELPVLTAIRRILRRERPSWDVVLASSGDDALRRLRMAVFHVIVTDLRMPEMNGADLLAAVVAEFPDTMRVVLSGYADSDLFARARSFAHATLAKPCAHQTVGATIQRLIGDA